MNNAVKSGNSGRVVLVLKVRALSFRGNGCMKYAYEMLHLIHNLIEKLVTQSFGPTNLICQDGPCTGTS